MCYEWDQEKARLNEEKHDIRFSDAVGVFEDCSALTREDTDSHEEQRFVTMGIDFLGRVLTVVYTYRQETIRLISARRATKREKQFYERRRL